MRVDPISKEEIRHRLGLKETGASSNSCGALSVGSGPDMGYNLIDEHQVFCPISGDCHGVVCTAILSQSIESVDADSIANNRELVSQAIMLGSLGASIRNRLNKSWNSVYYLPHTITLERTGEMESMESEATALNNEGLEIHNILMDLSDLELSDDDGSTEEEGPSVMMYACNTLAGECSATSDVYLLLSDKKGKILWRFSVEFKVATINLQQILSFGNRDSATPLRPKVLLKNYVS